LRFQRAVSPPHSVHFLHRFIFSRCGNNCSGRPSCPATGVTCKNCQRLGHLTHVCHQPKQPQQQARQPAASSTSRPQQQQAGGKKGKKKVNEYKRCKATGHAPIEQDAEPLPSLGSLYSVEEVDALFWTYASHPVVTGGRPTTQLRVSINNKSAGFVVPDTGASWTVVPHYIAQQHRLRVDQTITVSLRAANGQLMPVVGRTTFLLSALGHAKSTSAEVQALVCPGVSKI
jgi:hypothetical protein